MTRPRLLARKAIRPLLFVAGCLFVVIGIAGLVLPFVPGTALLILAAACFARSSPRFENWLVTHPQLGPSIAAWRKTGAIPLRAKFLAVGAMAASIVVTWYSGAPAIVLWATALFMAGAAVYIATRPSIRR